jgi:hypothetical protein
MKLLNHFSLFGAFICVLSLNSCTGYGNKVTFEGNKGEVYYKGDGVTEADAKAVGKFLEDAEFFQNDDKTRSVQISKENGRIQARFVVDAKAIQSLQDADDNFAIIGAAMSKDVFSNIPVDVIYTDDHFKDIKTIPYRESALAVANISDEIKQMDKKSYRDNTLYYSKDISSAQADTVSNYLIKSGFFSSEGKLDLILSKIPGSGFHIKFPIKSSFNNEEGLQKVDDFGKDIKRDLFPDTLLELEVLGKNMTSVKTFTY